jgi:hypothetical protein
LKIFNALFSLMVHIDQKPYLHTADAVRAGVLAGESHAWFAIDQAGSKAHDHAKPRKRAATNTLRLAIESGEDFPDIRTIWQDEEGMPLEGYIRDMAASILVIGELRYRSHEEHRYRWRVERKAEHEEAKRREAERLELARLEEIARVERKRRRRLLSDVLGWRRAAEIRAFVKAVKDREEPDPALGFKEKLKQWADWALGEADRLDPLKRTWDELLDYYWDSRKNDQ